MEFCHPPVVDVLATAHRVSEVNLPAVTVVNIAHRGSDSALGHDGMRLTEQRFANQRYLHSRGGSRYGGAQTGATGSDNKYVVTVGLIFGHQRIFQSVQTPMAHIRT